MLCSLISFSCFHVNSDAETRSAETQQTQISGPVGPTEPPLSVSVSMSPSLSLSDDASFFYFADRLFTGWISCNQSRLDSPPKLVHLSPSLHFLFYFFFLYCFFVIMCKLFFLELTTRWSELCRSKKFYTQVT